MVIPRTYRHCAPFTTTQPVTRFAIGLILFAVAGWQSCPAFAEPPDVDRYRVYELKYKDVSEVETVLNEMLESFHGTVDIVADAKFNRILLNGPEKAQKIAAKVLKSIDQPPAEEKPVATESVVKSYPCPKSKFNKVAERLRERFADQEGVRISGDPASERLLVLAPQDIHDELRLVFAQTDDQVEDAPRPKKNSSRTPAPPAELRENTRAKRTNDSSVSERRSQSAPVRQAKSANLDAEQFVELLHTRPDMVAPFLRKVLGPHLEPNGSSKDQFKVTDLRGVSIDLTIDRRRNAVRLSGEEDLCGQLVSIVKSLDDPSANGTESTRILPLRGIDPEKVIEVQKAFRLEARRGAAKRAKPKTDQLQGRRSAVSHANFSDDQTEFSTIRLVGSQNSSQTSSGDGASRLPVAEANDDLVDEMPDLKKQLRKLGAELDIEVISDLDVIILRGNKTDVQEMTRILNELEQLSIETEPKIEIYMLQHVRGESLAALIEKVNMEFTGGIRGKISITPLVKPNALLIIGWGETVTSVKQLIEKLDQPVPPDVQFQVFRLKHADATLARTTVQEFFTARSTPGAGTGAAAGSGLAPRVQVTADSRTNSLIVHAPPRDMQEASELIEQLDVPGGAVIHQARIFKLKNTLATDLAQILQSAIDAARGTPGAGAASQKSSQLEFLSIDKEGQQILKSGLLVDVKITAEPHTNSLLVSAAPESMELVAALIRKLDETITEGAQIKVFRMINGDATSLVQMLRSLLPPPSGPPGSAQLANSRDETSLVPTRFSVDLRTNSIIATGSVGDLRIVEALLLRLDQRDVEQRTNQVYRLKNASAIAVAKSINDFLRSERTVQQAAPGAISPFQQIESEVVVVPEPVGNSLIISATPRFFSEIEKLVERLDAQPYQVMIQVLIAQLTLNNQNEFGVELGLQDSLLFDRSLLSNLVTLQNSQSVSTPSGIVTTNTTNILGAQNTPGFAFNGAPLGNSGSTSALATASNIAGQAVSNFGVGTANPQLGYGGLVLSASSENVSVLLRALQQSSRLEILSRPQIRTLDNQPAFILVGQRVPRLNTVSVSTAGSVNGVLMENVGLILGVTPRISPEGMVVMEVDAESSSIDIVDQGIPVSVSTNGTIIRSPIFNITQAQTTVSANSGETIIIGGLITKNTNDVSRRIPILSDIPVLGNFFRYDSVIGTRSELLIILTPHVIRTPEDAARIKREEAAKMHWCAGDVMDIYGSGIVSDDPNPISETEVPVIYPDLNPRGTIAPPEVPPEPSAGLRGQISSDSENSENSKKDKKSGLFPFFSPKKSK